MATGAVTAPTRAALDARLAEPWVTEPRFFDQAVFAVLRAVCLRLVPDGRVDVAGPIDARLASGKTDGWRYDALPPDGEAFLAGLAAIEQSAHSRHGGSFVGLSPDQQDDVLREQHVGRFFEDLLAESAEVYFAHPVAQQAIGYVGYADAPGWQHIGLNEREEREPDAP